MSFDSCFSSVASSGVTSLVLLPLRFRSALLLGLRTRLSILLRKLGRRELLMDSFFRKLPPTMPSTSAKDGSLRRRVPHVALREIIEALS